MLVSQRRAIHELLLRVASTARPLSACVSSLGSPWQPAAVTPECSSPMHHAPDCAWRPPARPVVSLRGFAAGVGAQQPPELGGGGASTQEQQPLGSGSETRSTEDAAEGVRLQLLDSALKYTHSLGWSRAALEAAARELGLSPAAAGLVPQGALGLVEHFLGDCQERLRGQLRERAAELALLRTTDRVRLALRWRLELLAPHISTWPQALSLLATPRGAPVALRSLYDTVDEAWHAAGDRSTDYNWYTKRALLAGVYSATELYMTTDFSPGFADTWAALDRRLEDALRLGRAGAQASKALDAVQQGVKDWLSSRQQPEGRQDSAPSGRTCQGL